MITLLETVQIAGIPPMLPGPFAPVLPASLGADITPHRAGDMSIAAVSEHA